MPWRHLSGDDWGFLAFMAVVGLVGILAIVAMCQRPDREP